MILLLLLFIIIIIYLYKRKNIEHMQDDINIDKMSKQELNACYKIQNDTKLFKINMTKQLIYTKILKKTKKVLDELNIPFFLSSGTLLGFVRENKFLDHDYDIDIGIFKEDYNPEIINKMSDKGLKLYRILGDVNNGMELSFKLYGTEVGKHAKIDIFLHYKENDKIYWITYSPPKYEKRIKYQVSKFILKSVKFMGITVNIPYPTIKHIREHYGEKWYIPIKSKGAGGTYDFRTSPSSIVK
jgi:hypothetical protein